MGKAEARNKREVELVLKVKGGHDTLATIKQLKQIKAKCSGSLHRQVLP